MNHSRTIRLRNYQIKRKFRQLIEGLQFNLGVSSEELADLLQATPREFTNKNFEPNIEQLGRLAQRFHFSLNRFFKEDIDLEVIRQHRQGNQLVLSHKYQPAAFSKRRIIINMLDFVEAQRGSSMKRLLMDHLYLTDAIYLDPDGPVNVLLFEDATQYLFKAGFSASDIFQMGQHMAVTNQGTAFADRLKETKSVSEMYEYYLTDLIKTVEHNNFYQLKRLSNSECLLESFENPDLLDALKVEHAGGIGRCLCRAGTLAAAPAYRGLPQARIVETTCVHRGDDLCRFHINFEHAARLENAI